MPTEKSFKIRSKHNDLFLRVVKGHFATSHSHINYYIDVTPLKTNLDDARRIGRDLSSYYIASTLVDTVLCLDGTEVIGTCLARELTREHFASINMQQPISIITPEHTTGSQLIFRDNLVPNVTGKDVLVLAASVTTGYTAQAAAEAIRYYGGRVAGICAIFATLDTCSGIPVNSIFNPNDLKDYISFPSHECPLCKQGKKIDALVNSYGYSRL